MRLLLHICCSPCLCVPVEELKKDGIEIEGFFYNPNIHPLLEFRRRLKSVKVYQESSPMRVHYCEDYGLNEFLNTIEHHDAPQRCGDCYHMRLVATARYARQNGFDAFSTALLFSARQKHELLKKTGEEVSRKEGLPFYYTDYRHLYAESRETARKKCLYLQSYCGCIFSESERYGPTNKYLYKGELNVSA
ncbi:MAG: epoxyqueuosine reductase QueH [Planctomycetota bacterium]|jgi:predicted adenine nucleotide alpha hydrolase (AANH) superfamily ATPase